MICITLERWNERTRVASIEVSFRFVRSRARRAVIDVVVDDDDDVVVYRLRSQSFLRRLRRPPPPPPQKTMNEPTKPKKFLSKLELLELKLNTKKLKSENLIKKFKP